MTTDIVVGYDGSVGAESAVDWAAREAAFRGVWLRVVIAEPWVPLSHGAAGAGAVPPRGNHRADGILAEGRLRAVSVLGDVRLESAVVPGHAPVALVRESRHAALLVVGHEAHGRVRELVRGSVATAVALHSSCDVVVVPPADTAPVGPDRPVVVGVDDSDLSDRPARRAARIAADRAASLVVVQTGGGRRPERHGLAVGTDALTDACRGAGLLVVGTHSLGGPGRAVLGSVGRSALRLSVVPVLVVRC